MRLRTSTPWSTRAPAPVGLQQAAHAQGQVFQAAAVLAGAQGGGDAGQPGQR